MITKETLGLRIEKDVDGNIFVCDDGLKCKSLHPDLLTAHAFIAGIVSIYNNKNKLN